MREDIIKSVMEIMSIYEEKKSISETDLQAIFVKNKLGIKDINIISNYLATQGIETKEDLKEIKDEPDSNEIEEIDKEKNLVEEDEELSVVKKVFSNTKELDEEQLIELANIVKHSSTKASLKRQISNWFMENNIEINLDKYNLDELTNHENKIIKEDNTYTADPIRMYLKEIGKIDLLSPKKEKEIAKTINEYQSIIKDLDESDPNYNDVVNKYIHYKKKFAEHNLRLVVSIAKKYMGRGVDFLDLIQEGNIGLEKAIEKFDHTKGFKFSTYATWWIRQSITRAIDDQSTTIRIPVHLRERMNKLTRITRELEFELQRTPTNKELLPLFYPNMKKDLEKKLGRQATEKEMNEEIERCYEELRYIQKITRENDLVSLETPIRGDEDEDSIILDFIADESQQPVEDKALQSSLRNNLNEVLGQLTIRERITMMMRYGLYDDIIKPEEKEALATKIVLKKLPKEDFAKIKKINDYLNEEYQIKPINSKIKNNFNNNDYLDNINSYSEYYKATDPFYENNKNRSDYDDIIKTIISYNTLANINPKSNNKSTLNNNLNVNTYIYLREKYKDYFNYGYMLLTQGNHRTLEDVGSLFDVTRERVRQIEAKAIKKVRNPNRSKYLKDFI